MSGYGVVVGKEMRELLFRRGLPSWTPIGLVAGSVFLGVVFPTVWALLLEPMERRVVLSLADLVGPFLAPTMAFGGVLAVVVDAIAGERERHTLPTLLASPLRDWEILLGKLTTIIAVPLANVLLLDALGVLTFKVLFGARYDPHWLLFGVGLAASFLLTLIFAAVGVLVSIRAPTVKQGQQMLGYVFMPVPIAFFLVSTSGLAAVSGMFTFANPLVVVLVYAVGYLVVVVGLYVAAFHLFSRDRLMRV